MESISLFAERLKETRTKQNMKQAELAERVGVSTQTISAYEKGGAIGKGKNPTLENAIRIAEVLNVSLDWLCGIEIAAGERSAGVTLGTVARMLVEMNWWDTVDFGQVKRKEIVACGYSEFIDAEHGYPAVVFCSGDLRTFLSDLNKMIELVGSKTISNEFFDRWLDDRFSSLDKISADTQYPFATDNQETEPPF